MTRPDYHRDINFTLVVVHLEYLFLKLTILQEMEIDIVK